MKLCGKLTDGFGCQISFECFVATEHRSIIGQRMVERNYEHCYTVDISVIHKPNDLIREKFGIVLESKQ